MKDYTVVNEVETLKRVYTECVCLCVCVEYILCFGV